MVKPFYIIKVLFTAFINCTYVKSLSMSFFFFTYLLFYFIYYDQDYLLFVSKFYWKICYANVKLDIYGEIYNWPDVSFRCNFENWYEMLYLTWWHENLAYYGQVILAPDWSVKMLAAFWLALLGKFSCAFKSAKLTSVLKSQF